MSALPRVEYQQSQQPVEARPDLGVHRSEGERNLATQTKTLVADQTLLAGMLVCCGVFAFAFAAYLVIPYIQTWMAISATGSGGM